jgi:hypothetical protein
VEDVLIGIADRTVLVFIPDPASTTGAGKTGLAAAAITVTYTRVETDNDVVHTDVTSSLSDLSALTDAHADWGWKEVSATLSKGLYRLDLADAVFASGAWYAVVQVTITSGTAAATPKAFRLIARNDLTDIAQTGDGYAIVARERGAQDADRHDRRLPRHRDCGHLGSGRYRGGRHSGALGRCAHGARARRPARQS